MTNSEDLKQDLRFLIDQKDIINASDVFYSADVWTMKKLILLSRYIYPYLCILTNREDNGKYKYSESWFYLDLFSGSGATKVRDKYCIIGSPIVSILKGYKYIKKRNECVRFTKWFLGDKDVRKCKALEQRVEAALKQINQEHCVIPRSDIHINCGNCNDNITLCLEEIKKHKKFSILAFIDPEGFTEIEWATFKKLFEMKYVDMIFIYSTSGCKRGLTEENSSRCMPPHSHAGLTIGQMKKLSCDTLTENFIHEMLLELKRKQIWYESLPIFTEKENELYRIIWASSSKGAANSIESVLKYLNKLKNEDLLNTLEVISGKQSDLFHFSK